MKARLAFLVLLAAAWHGPVRGEVHALHVASAAPGETMWDPQADGQVGISVLSADARFVVFASLASNLVPGDTNGTLDTFLIDREQGTIERVNLGDHGQQANGPTYVAHVSGDGRFVVFTSLATNLVSGPGARHEDVFLRDRQTGTTRQLSADVLFGQTVHRTSWPSLSDDGRFVVFSAQASPSSLVLVYEIESETLEIANIAPNDGIVGANTNERAAISGDGRYVVFITQSIWNEESNALLRDRQSGTTTRIDMSSAAPREYVYEPSISRDGRFISFASSTLELVAGDTNGHEDVFIHDRELGTTERVSLDLAGSRIEGDSFPAGLSDDGRFVSFRTTGIAESGDQGPVQRNYVRDRLTGTTERICQTPEGEAGNGWGLASYHSLAGDGSMSVFSSGADNLVDGDTNGLSDLFIRDHRLQRTERINFAAGEPLPAAGNGMSTLAGCCGRRTSAAGDLVVFSSSASNLVTNDDNGMEDVFLYEVDEGRNHLLSRSLQGTPGNGRSHQASISADGRWVAFTSASSNLVPGDSNGVSDVFLLDRESEHIQRISISGAGAQGDSASLAPAISGNGKFVAFESASLDLAPDGHPGRRDLFLHHVGNGVTERMGRMTRLGEPILSQVVHAGISNDSSAIVFLTHYDPSHISITDYASGLYVIDRTGGEIRQLLPGFYFDPHAIPSLSDDGRWLAVAAFHWESGWPSAPRMLLYDLLLDTPMEVSRCLLAPGQIGRRSWAPSLSGDGRFLAFSSEADCLVEGDSNGRSDIFVYDRLLDRMSRVDTDRFGTEGPQGSELSDLSANGDVLAFTSFSGGWRVDRGRIGGYRDVFVAKLKRLYGDGFE